MAKKTEAEVENPTTTTTKAVNFFQETKEEFSKVVWPSRQQLISESAAVVGMVVLSATFIYLLDKILDWAALKVFG